jgi:hypothetical protein
MTTQADMSEHTTTPRPQSSYTDTHAVDDIHALVSKSEFLASGELAAIAEIIERTGRPMVAGRDIDVTTTQTALGWPVITISSGGTAIIIRQEPMGTGLRADITAATQAERDSLTITLNGHPLRC